MGGSDDESSELLSSSSRLRAREVRYKGLAKNEAQLYSLFGLANLVICNQKLAKGFEVRCVCSKLERTGFTRE